MHLPSRKHRPPAALKDSDAHFDAHFVFLFFFLASLRQKPLEATGEDERGDLSVHHAHPAGESHRAAQSADPRCCLLHRRRWLRAAGGRLDRRLLAPVAQPGAQ